MTSQTVGRILRITNTPTDDDETGAAAVAPDKQLAHEQDVQQQDVGEPQAAIEEPQSAAGERQPALAEPESAYGCVDWFLYPVPASGEG